MTGTIPQVALFGSIGGGWREAHIIPVLEELGVTYFNPVLTDRPWTEADGQREAEVMANAEVIVMVFNNLLPSFGGLVETGWAAAGTLQRGQTLILCVAEHYRLDVPGWFRAVPVVRALVAMVEDQANRARLLVRDHARQMSAITDNVIVAATVEDVATALREYYA